MYASVGIQRATREIRPTRTIGTGDERRTVRVTTGRGNARRAAINASWAAR